MTDPAASLTAALADRYRIEREIGAGGMATVYLAYDVKHDRKVALKVLKPELSAILGADRFLHEIKTTANLQHPHILALHDSGEAGGMVFYVMPYVEGESLRDRLTREKQLPVEDAVRIAREVADALDYAHRHGVVHRDIKPENILLHDGRAQVADFGIALAAARTDGGTRMTETGMSLGTPFYMSPEQAMGEREITAKSDVYALGCVTYEMLVGEPPFMGPTAQAIIARVMTEAPRSLQLQRHTIPTHVEAAIRRALEKLPADRFQSAAEFATAINDPRYASRITVTTLAQGASPRGARRWALPAALGAIVLLGALALWGWLRPVPAPPVIRYTTTLSDDTWSGFFLARGVAISPDGSFIVFRNPPTGRGQLYLRRRDEIIAQPLAGTEGGSAPFFSPDGAWIGFTADGQLRKMPAIGGGSVKVADSASNLPGSWGDDGNIVYAQGNRLRRVPASGGLPEAFGPEFGEGLLPVFPVVLPGARGVLYTRCTPGCTSSAVMVYDIAKDTARVLLDDALLARYSPTGHILLLTRAGTLLAAPWDNDALATAGPALPVLDGVQAPGFVLSSGGGALYTLGPSRFANGAALNREAVWLDRNGRLDQVDPGWRFNIGDANWGLALSPDGHRLAIRLNTDLGSDVWVKQLPTGAVSRLTFSEAVDRMPRWAPGGREITFVTTRPLPGDTAGRSEFSLWSRAADGTGEASLLWAGGDIAEGFWTPDRQSLIMRSGGVGGVSGGRDILVARPGTDTVARPLLGSRYDEWGPSLSPDGRWLAYLSEETGSTELFIRPFPEVDRGKWQVSNGGASAGVWSHSGRELFYTNDRKMHAVEIRPGPPFSLGEPKVLFTLPDRVFNGNPMWGGFDIAPDDKRFLMLRAVVLADSSSTAGTVMVYNFFEELKRRTEK